jgi:FkbM family methyltransferase
VANHCELTERSPVSWCKEVLMQPPGPWPSADWVGYPNIVQAVQELLREARDDPPAPPPFPVPRGIVICGGGWRFFPSIYVVIRAIRHVGCNLPIQVWYMGDAGEYDVRMHQCTERYGVQWIDANSAWRERPEMRIRRNNIDHGWMLKPFAAAYCPFREVLFLDADCYPVMNPEDFMGHPEYRRVGASFWPDQNPLEGGQWERFGVPPQACPGLESGQFIIDKGRHWKPLYVACLINALWDFTYRHLYGDKDTFNIAWRLCGHEMCVPQSRPGWHVHTFVHRHFDGRILFLHRTRDKFKLTGEIDGQGIPDHYSTRQIGPGNRWLKNLPLENECRDWLNECDTLLRPGLHFDLLGNPAMVDVWMRIVRANEYRLAPHYRRDQVAVDVGACLGATTHALLCRGMGHVHAVEPVGTFVDRWSHNLRHFPDRVTVHRCAAWRSDEGPHDLPLWGGDPAAGSELVANTYGGPLSLGKVDAVPLDTILAFAAAQAGGRVRLLKIDIEGGEYPCLLTAQALGLVDEIVGEWHDADAIPSHCRVDGYPEFSGRILCEFLRGQGFAVEAERNAEAPQLGLFWARRA